MSDKFIEYDIAYGCVECLYGNEVTTSEIKSMANKKLIEYHGTVINKLDHLIYKIYSEPMRLRKDKNGAFIMPKYYFERVVD